MYRPTRTLLGAAVAVLAVLAGCATAPASATFKGMTITTVSAVTMTCSDPYPLTQNCSSVGGASLRVGIKGQVARLAATSDGRTVVVMTDAAIPSQTKSEEAAEAVGTVVEATGARLLKMEALAVIGGIVLGYVLHFDRDVYTALRRNALPS